MALHPFPQLPDSPRPCQPCGTVLHVTPLPNNCRHSNEYYFIRRQGTTAVCGLASNSLSRLEHCDPWNSVSFYITDPTLCRVCNEKGTMSCMRSLWPGEAGSRRWLTKWIRLQPPSRLKATIRESFFWVGIWITRICLSLFLIFRIWVKKKKKLKKVSLRNGYNGSL